MAKSLQEQLMQAGVASKSAAKQARTEKRKKKKQNKNQAAGPSEAQQAAEQTAAEKKQRDLALNQQQQAEKEKKAIAAQIKQLIEMNVQPRNINEADDTVLNFTDDNVVKRINVGASVHKQVVSGRLSVVKLDDQYVLVPMPVADKIAQRDESVVIFRADTREEEKADSQEDDWYADYEIPDDLMW